MTTVGFRKFTARDLVEMGRKGFDTWMGFRFIPEKGTPMAKKTKKNKPKKPGY